MKELYIDGFRPAFGGYVGYKRINFDGIILVKEDGFVQGKSLVGYSNGKSFDINMSGLFFTQQLSSRKLLDLILFENGKIHRNDKIYSSFCYSLSKSYGGDGKNMLRTDFLTIPTNNFFKYKGIGSFVKDDLNYIEGIYKGNFKHLMRPLDVKSNLAELDYSFFCGDNEYSTPLEHIHLEISKIK